MRNDQIVSFLMSFVATLLTFAYGPERTLLYALFLLMLADYLTGILASCLDGKGLSSRIGFRGLAKKFVVLIIIAVTHHIDLILGTSVAMLGAIYFYAGLELISITENAGRMGIPMPGLVKNVIRDLKSKGGDSNDSEMESQISDHEVPSDSTK